MKASSLCMGVLIVKRIGMDAGEYGKGMPDCMLPDLRQECFCRSPAHCIEYVHLIQWQHERGTEEFDADEETHMRWVYDRACQRAEHFGIQVMSFMRPCSCHSCASTGYVVS